MLQRFTELKDSIKMTLALIDSRGRISALEPEEWVACEELCKVLQPFEEVTRRMSGEQYVTGSEVILFTRGLNNVLCKLGSEVVLSSTKKVVSLLKGSLNQRCKNLAHSNTISIATLLDPRFKVLAFEDQAALQQAKTQIIGLLERAIMNSLKSVEKPTQDSEAVPAMPETNSLSVWYDFDLLVSKTATPMASTRSVAIVEFNRYLEAPYLKRDGNPLEWWYQHQHLYPNLCSVVEKRFNFLATSVPCERIFSKAGNVISARRTCLSAKHVEQLLFLNVNDSAA